MLAFRGLRKTNGIGVDADPKCESREQLPPEGGEAMSRAAEAVPLRARHMLSTVVMAVGVGFGRERERERERQEVTCGRRALQGVRRKGVRV